jgi:hypothetical protein
MARSLLQASVRALREVPSMSQFLAGAVTSPQSMLAPLKVIGSFG